MIPAGSGSLSPPWSTRALSSPSRWGCGARQPTPPPGLDEAQLAGWQAYVDLNCASCHGESREGKRSGLPLKGLAEHWSAEQLARYLADPDAVVRATPRLAYKAEQYAIAMPAVSGNDSRLRREGERGDAGVPCAEDALVDVQMRPRPIPPDGRSR